MGLWSGETVEADLVMLRQVTRTCQWVGLFCGANVKAKVGTLGHGSGRDDPGPYIGELRNQWAGQLRRTCGSFAGTSRRQIRSR